MGWIIPGLALVGAVAWLLRRPRRRGRGPGDRDDAVLREAEEEVQELDALTSPDEADDELGDWGPGVPR